MAAGWHPGSVAARPCCSSPHAPSPASEMGTAIPRASSSIPAHPSSGTHCLQLRRVRRRLVRSCPPPHRRPALPRWRLFVSGSGPPSPVAHAHGRAARRSSNLAEAASGLTGYPRRVLAQAPIPRSTQVLRVPGSLSRVRNAPLRYRSRRLVNAGARSQAELPSDVVRERAGRKRGAGRARVEVAQLRGVKPAPGDAILDHASASLLSASPQPALLRRAPP